MAFGVDSIEKAGLVAVQGTTDMQRVVVWSIGLIIALLVMMGLIAWFRKRMAPTEEMQPQGFTLADLRELRKKGAMTEEEFERAKAKIVESIQAATAREARKSASGGSDPPAPPTLGI